MTTLRQLHQGDVITDPTNGNYVQLLGWKRLRNYGNGRAIAMAGEFKLADGTITILRDGDLDLDLETDLGFVMAAGWCEVCDEPIIRSGEHRMCAEYQDIAVWSETAAIPVATADGVF